MESSISGEKQNQPGFADSVEGGVLSLRKQRRSSGGGLNAAHDALTAEQRQWLTSRRPVVRIGVTSIPPQVFHDPETGELSGLCIDFIDDLARVLSYRFEVVYFATWNAMMQAAFARDIDVIYAAQKTPSRMESFLFTKPYLLSTIRS
jgi:ABC-type amino acid transport substrate-binding protein